MCQGLLDTRERTANKTPKSLLSRHILSRGKEKSFFLSTIWSMCITKLLPE